MGTSAIMCPYRHQDRGRSRNRRMNNRHRRRTTMLATDRGLRCLLAIMCLLVTGGSSFGQRTARYTRPVVAGQQEPAAVLARAKTVLGFDRVTKPIMHYHAV